MNATIDRLVGRLADVLFLSIAGLVIAAMVVIGVPRFRSSLSRALAPATSLKIGDRIDEPPALYSTRSVTVFLFASSSCPACRYSAPVYASLRSEMEKRSKGFVLVLNDDPTTPKARAFVAGFGAPALTTWNGMDSRVKAVPAVAVVDQKGRVIYAEEGSPASPAEFLSKVIDVAR